MANETFFAGRRDRQTGQIVIGPALGPGEDILATDQELADARAAGRMVTQRGGVWIGLGPIHQAEIESNDAAALVAKAARDAALAAQHSEEDAQSDALIAALVTSSGMAEADVRNGLKGLMRQDREP